MTQNPISEQIRSYRILSARNAELFQHDLLSSQQLKQYAQSMNLQIFSQDTINLLWKVGLLRADLIISDNQINISGINAVFEKDSQYYYADLRDVPHRPCGYGSVFGRGEFDGDFELRFHPFRIFVLYHITRVFGLHITDTQYLSNSTAFTRMTDMHVEHLDEWTAKIEFSARFDYWNLISELAIVLEPIFYPDVFLQFKYRIPNTEESHRQKLALYGEGLSAFIRKIGETYIEQARTDLVTAAEVFDDNKMLHVLIRLISRPDSIRLKGNVGAAMTFIKMAEVIRRATEKVLQKHLPEEDEMGFGQWMDGARLMIYGTERIFDASQTEKRDYLTGLGLDVGIKVCCYVEGETEQGALQEALGELSQIKIVNLKGQVAEKGGSGLAFVESLRSDIKNQIFSIVVLDGDVSDNVRLLRRAVKDGNFFGRFVILNPDFEVANFSPSELLQIAHDWAKSVSPESDLVPVSSPLNLNCGKDIERHIACTYGRQFSKGQEWGKKLMEYAIEHRNYPSCHTNAGQIRPLIDLAQFAIKALRLGYADCKRQYAVDPQSGGLMKKGD